MSSRVWHFAVLVAFAAGTLQPGAAPAQAPQTHRHGFGGAEQWAHVFDDPARDAWQKPHQVIEALALRPDAKVADIGSGTGYFSVRLARFVPEGRVYGVDIEPDMVKHLALRAQREKLANVVSLQGRPETPGLPEKVDLALFVDVYHHIDGREAYFGRLRESLAPGGRVAIIDFTMDSPVGPPRGSRIEKGLVEVEMKRAGYVLDVEHGFLPNQYFLVFAPVAR